MNSKESFNDIPKWINKIRELKHNKDFPIILIGNKIDLENERVINKEQGDKVAKDYKFDFYETSAKTGKNVKEAFQHLINLIVKYKEDELLNNIIKKETIPNNNNNGKIDGFENEIDKNIINKDKECCSSNCSIF